MNVIDRFLFYVCAAAATLVLEFSSSDSKVVEELSFAFANQRVASFIFSSQEINEEERTIFYNI
jgi:hypothetical protein